MSPEEISDRLEFLESLCNHGPWKAWYDSMRPVNVATLRCTKCGAPIDHQHDFDKYPGDLVR